MNVVDVVGFTGHTGLDGADDPVDQALGGYLMSAFLELNQGRPFDRLLLTNLVAYAGTGTADAYLVDRRPASIVDGLVRAGWEGDGELLVPGPDVARLTASLGRYVRVTDEDGLALVVIARDRGDLPDPGPAPEPGPVAARLVELGGAVGTSFDIDASCGPQAVSLYSSSKAAVLVRPPQGVSPDAVGVDSFEVPEGFSSLEAVRADGDLVRLDVTVPGPDGPLQLLQRLGLPGAELC